MSRILFVAKSLSDANAHEQTIICRQLFADHVVDSRPMKRKKKLHRMKINIFSTDPPRPFGIRAGKCWKLLLASLNLMSSSHLEEEKAKNPVKQHSVSTTRELLILENTSSQRVVS